MLLIGYNLTSSNSVRVLKIARLLFLLKLIIISVFLPGTISLENGYLQARQERAVLALGEEIELPLRIRRIQYAFDGDQDSERDATYEFLIRNLKVNETALILIDVWASHPIEGWKERAEVNIQDKLYPLLQEARKAGLLVIHAPHGIRIHTLATPLEGEMVLDWPYDAYQVFDELRNRGIKTLIYAGYATNMCVLVRPIGIIQAKGQNFDVILVRDATIAVETPESLDGEWAHRMAVHFVEANFGYTTTVEDFRIAVIRAQLPHTTFLPVVFSAR